MQPFGLPNHITLLINKTLYVKCGPILFKISKFPSKATAFRIFARNNLIYSVIRFVNLGVSPVASMLKMSCHSLFYSSISIIKA